MRHELKADLWIGPLVAFAITTLWISSLIFILSTNFSQLNPLWILPALLWRTFIQTGLFIIAHDAIHGNVFPKSRLLNHWIGSLALTLYGFLPYKELSLSHWKHHRSPGQSDDPDFHDGIHQSFFEWYLMFMTKYLDAELRCKFLLCMIITFCTLRFGFQVSGFNLFMFWLLPLVLSSLQLFFFGTYLPHRASDTETHDSHHAVSSKYPTLLSFVTCYHFGYHWEHHEYPDVAWYGLPQVYQSRQHQIKAAIANLAS